MSLITFIIDGKKLHRRGGTLTDKHNVALDQAVITIDGGKINHDSIVKAALDAGIDKKWASMLVDNMLEDYQSIQLAELLNDIRKDD